MPVVSIPTTLDVVEGQSLSVPITKSGSGACSVRFRTKSIGSATWNVDYTGIDQTVTFSPSEELKTVTVKTLADKVADAGETFQVVIDSPAGCTLGNAACMVTIIAAPTIDMGPDITVPEGGTALFTLTKSGAGACSVTVKTQAGTAAYDKDYTGIAATTLGFASTDKTKSLSIPVTKDIVAEGDEKFSCIIVPGSEKGCKVGRRTAAATIRNVAPPPPPPPVVEPDQPTESVLPTEPPQETEDTEAGPETSLPAPKGFGNAKGGGIGKPIYRVTSLADTETPGTLRHALLTAGTGGRMIVFEVGGVIKITSRINVLRAYDVTVAGETAPAPGIVLQASGKFNGPIMVLFDCRNFHFSNICFEQIDHNWKVGDTNYDGFGTEPRAGEKCENIWVDHCATFWTQDEAASIYHGSSFNSTSALRNISITNTMFAEPLWKSELAGSQPHWEGGRVDEPEHNFNLLIGRNARNVDVQYCLFQDATWRNPWIDVGTTAVLANNVSNNCQHAAAVQMNDAPGSTLLSVVGYLVITGPNTTNTALSGLRIHNVRTGAGRAHKFYAEGLYGWKGAGAKVSPTGTIFLRDAASQKPFVTNTRPIDCPTPVKALSADEIYDRALLNVGPRPKERMIPSVAKAIEKLRRKTGKYVQLPSQVGGPSVLVPAKRALGAEGADDSPGNFPDGSPLPPLPKASDAAAMAKWLRTFKDSVQFD